MEVEVEVEVEVEAKLVFLCHFWAIWGWFLYHKNSVFSGRWDDLVQISSPAMIAATRIKLASSWQSNDTRVWLMCVLTLDREDCWTYSSSSRLTMVHSKVLDFDDVRGIILWEDSRSLESLFFWSSFFIFLDSELFSRWSVRWMIEPESLLRVESDVPITLEGSLSRCDDDRISVYWSLSLNLLVCLDSCGMETTRLIELWAASHTN